MPERPDPLGGDATDRGPGVDTRREAMAKIGRFAYVAPAMALLTEPLAAAAYGVRPGYGHGDRNHVHYGPRGRRR